MNEALIEARKAYRKNEVPIGAVIVRKGEVIIHVKQIVLRLLMQR